MCGSVHGGGVTCFRTGEAEEAEGVDDRQSSVKGR